MRIFVTGGTGAIGRFALPALVDAGHEVTALARDDAKARWVAARGARTARVSLFDVGALTDAFAGHDVVANLATAIPPPKEAVRASAWRSNERIRTEGSTAVVDAALAAGVGRVIQESIAFAYPDHGDEWVDESLPIDPPPGIDSLSVAEGNAIRFTEAGHVGVVLRFGFFYGPGSVHSEGFLRAARRHIGPVLGSPRGYQSAIHLADAASAVVAALEAPAGIYNIVDDEPLTKREGARAIGASVGKRPWLYLPGRLALIGGNKSAVLTRSLRVSNARFKEATGWAPRYPSVREGWRARETVHA